MAETKQPTLFDSEEILENGETSHAEVRTQTGKRVKKTKEPLSNKQQLSSTIKSVRDLLRKDAGLSGDTDRLPQLVWLLFLKNLDDFEASQEELLGEEYIPIIAEKYRWRDWVVTESLTGRRKGD